MPKSANKNRCGRQVAKTIEFARSFAIVHFECAYDLMYYLVCILVFEFSIKNKRSSFLVRRENLKIQFEAHVSMHAYNLYINILATGCCWCDFRLAPNCMESTIFRVIL